MIIKCIYCLEEKAEVEYTKREHVIPQCFGKFSPNNLILNNAVCNDCNQFFGDNIELFLARDTIEGTLMRYKQKIKPESEPRRHKRLKFEVAEGKFKGLQVKPKYSKTLGEDDIEILPQIGFFNKNTQQYIYFKIEEVPTIKELKEQGFDFTVNADAHFDQSEKEKIEKLLKDKGINIKFEDCPNKEKLDVCVKGEIMIDPVIYRGFSKIVFNYLTYTEGKDFVLLKDFDGIRNFIRYGDGEGKNYFKTNLPPILYKDKVLQKFGAKSTNGHIVVIEWLNTNLVGKLSIFNAYTYGIVLCKNFSGVCRPIKSGHHFNIESKEVEKLGHKIIGII